MTRRAKPLAVLGADRSRGLRRHRASSRSLLVALGAVARHRRATRPSGSWITGVLLVDVAHVWSTAFVVYLDPRRVAAPAAALRADAGRRVRRRRRALRAGGAGAVLARARLPRGLSLRPPAVRLGDAVPRAQRRARSARPLARRRDDLRRDALSADRGGTRTCRASFAWMRAGDFVAGAADVARRRRRRRLPRAARGLRRARALPAGAPRPVVVGQAPRRRHHRGVLVRRHRRDEQRLRVHRHQRVHPRHARTWRSSTSTRATPRASRGAARRERAAARAGPRLVVFLVDAVGWSRTSRSCCGTARVWHDRELAVRRGFDIGELAR